MSDVLDSFSDLESCPSCACLTSVGALRCPECGTFHQDIDTLPERDTPPQTIVEVVPPDLDPALYSLNPRAEIPVSEEPEDVPDPTKNWGDSSTDFSFDDKAEFDLLKQRVSQSSEISEGGEDE